MSAVRPESNNSPALTVLGTPEVTVCIVLSMLFHLTVVPTLMLIGFGEYDLLPSVAAPFDIKTSLVLVLLEVDSSDGCSSPISCVVP